MKPKELFSNTFWVILHHAFYRGSVVVSTMLIARSVTASEFASFAYFQLTIAMISTYAAIGLGVTSTRYFSEAGTQGFKWSESPVALIWLVSLFTGLFVSSIVLLLPESILSAGLGVDNWMLALGVFALTTNIVPSGGVMGLERYRAASIIAFSSGLIVIFTAVYAARLQAIEVAILGVVTAVLVQAIGQSIIVVRSCGWGNICRSLSISKNDFKIVFGFAGPMFFVSLLSASGVWFVGRMILHLDGENSFALYAICMQWYGLCLFFPGVVSRVVLPQFVKLTLSNEAASQSSKADLIRLSGAVCGAVACLMVMAVFIFSPWLLNFYGSNYESYRLLLLSFCIPAVIAAPINSFGNAIVATGGQRAWFKYTIASTSVLVAVCALTPWIGIWTGPLSFTMSGLLLGGLSVFKLREMKLI